MTAPPSWRALAARARRLGMTRPLSSYGIEHPVPRKVDYYQAAGVEVHIIHDEGCQRAMTPDGLCTCVDPQAYEVRA